MDRNDQILSGAFVGTIIACVLFAVGWENNSATLAAWIQAVGSILAIAWAILLWRRDRRNAAEGRKARARVAAFRLAPILVDIGKSLDLAFKALREIDARLHDPNRYVELVHMAQQMFIFPPEPAESIYADFDCLPPEIAGRAALLFYTVGRHARYLPASLKIVEAIPTMHLPKFVGSERKVLADIQHDLHIVQRMFAIEFAKEFPEGKPI